MILVFDLDDTLYEEITFVKSGFREVAMYLEANFNISSIESYELMQKVLEASGRGRVFDDLLTHYGIYTKGLVNKCIKVYRFHKPDIYLSAEGAACLSRFEDVPIYIVTDGNKIVQKNKLVALGLYEKVKFPFITHRYGVKNCKPSPFCFLKICELEKVTPNQVVYIADNPNKDFVGIKPLGFKTIRVQTGCFKELNLSQEYQADYTINSLCELTDDFLKFVINNTTKE